MRRVSGHALRRVDLSLLGYWLAECECGDQSTADRRYRAVRLHRDHKNTVMTERHFASLRAPGELS